jgi:hypothetical protein
MGIPGELRRSQKERKVILMPDITMCKRDGCPSKERCYRYMAKPWTEGQCYFAPPYVKIKKGKCEYFWLYTPGSPTLDVIDALCKMWGD